MREAIAGSNIEAGDVIDGNWIPADAEKMVSGWLRMVMSGKSHLDLVGCQNDLMATGARKALETVGEYLSRPDLATIRLTGCDGLPIRTKNGKRRKPCRNHNRPLERNACARAYHCRNRARKTSACHRDTCLRVAERDCPGRQFQKDKLSQFGDPE